MHVVTVQADSEGAYIVLPDGWRIEPADSEVLIIQEEDQMGWIVSPVIGQDGLPTSRLIIPDSGGASGDSQEPERD
jgi:hypothetical protein